VLIIISAVLVHEAAFIASIGSLIFHRYPSASISNRVKAEA
jgi:hypothetical protein